MMSAALNTTERGPKTTKARKSASPHPHQGRSNAGRPKTLAQRKVEKSAEADAAFNAAMSAAEGFPHLEAALKTWHRLRLIEADREAVHADREARRASAASIEAANDIWQAAIEARQEAAQRLLDYTTADPDAIIAKVAAYTAISERPLAELTDGGSAQLLGSVIADLAAQSANRTQVDRTAWETAVAAYHAAVAEVDANGGEVNGAGDREAAAHEALLMTPAPDFHAVAHKLSFVGEFRAKMEDRFLTEDMARSLVGRGNSWEDRVISTVFLDSLRLARAGGTGSTSTPTWDALVDRLDTLMRAAHDAEELEEEAHDSVEAAHPVPPELQNPLTVTIGGLDRAQDLTLVEKAARLPILQEWLRQKAEAKEKLGFSALHEQALAAGAAADRARQSLLEAQPPTLDGLCLQMREHLRNWDSVEDVDTVEGIAEVLADGGCAADLARMYVHAVRLSGATRPEGWGEQFDPAAWVEKFQALPGHTLEISRYGGRAGPVYADPAAWGPDMPAYDDIKVTDPDAIARYDAWVRARYTDEQWERQLSEQPWGWISRHGKGLPYVAQDEQHIEHAYPDENDPERIRLLAMLELRHQRATRKLAPLGESMWTDLAHWQQAVVRTYVVDHPELFPENRTWSAGEWVAAFEAAGGTFCVDGDEVVRGLPYPPTLQQTRLMDVCERESSGFTKEQVKQVVLARGKSLTERLRQMGAL